MINIEKLKQLFSEDEKLIEQFLGIFKTDIPQYLSKLSDATQKGDWGNISIFAHSIKSQSKYLDLKKIVSIAETIEHKAELEEGLEDIASLLQDLEALLSDTIESM